MIYEIELTPFRVELCNGEPSYAVRDLVLIKSKEGIDIGRILSMRDGANEYTYGEVLRRITQKDLEKQKEFTGKMLKQYFYKRSKINPPVLIDGHEIMKIFKISEGPRIGKLLSTVRENQAEGTIKDKHGAVKLIRRLLN